MKNLVHQAETVTQLPRLHNKLATPLVTNALTPVHQAGLQVEPAIVMHNAQQTILILMKTFVQQADTLVQKVLLVLVVGREQEMNNALQDFQPIIKA